MAEWLGYPKLKKEDIEKLSPYFTRFQKHEAEEFVRIRMGRVVVLFDHEFYQEFLDAVRKRYGDIAHHHVNGAALEAIKEWVQKNK